jgi:hypothetical protein
MLWVALSTLGDGPGPAAPTILKITKEQLYENYTYNSRSARNYGSCIM